MSNEFVVLELWVVFRYRIDDLNFRTRDILMLVGLFPINVEPFGVDWEVHFVFCHFGGLVVIERVAVFVPGTGVQADEGLFILLGIILLLHICIIAIHIQSY